MSEIPNFWNDDHPLATKSEELFNQLIPLDGHCPSLQGELLRASTKINYDWFNNGWSCNNWSGAVVFLKKFFSELPVQPDIETHVAFEGALSYVEEYSHGEPAPYNKERADEVVTRIQQVVVQAIIDNPDLIANTRDMYDFTEEDYACSLSRYRNGDGRLEAGWPPEEF